jgi:hypothetical protein
MQYGLVSVMGKKGALREVCVSDIIRELKETFGEDWACEDVSCEDCLEKVRKRYEKWFVPTDTFGFLEIEDSDEIEGAFLRMEDIGDELNVERRDDSEEPYCLEDYKEVVKLVYDVVV